MGRYDEEDDDGIWEEGDDEEEESGDGNDEELDALIEETTEYVETGEARKAIRLWKRSMDRFADEPLAYFHLGVACQRYLEEELGGRKLTAADVDLLPFYDEGVSAYEEAASMEPENTEALNALGKLHKMRGRAKPAREAWEKSLEINEDQPEIASELEDL